MKSSRPYVFDIARGRAIVGEANSATPSEAPLGRKQLDAIITYLDARGDRALLRRFAVHSAERASPTVSEPMKALLAAARADADRPDEQALLDARAAYHGVAMAAGSVGLPHGASNAASFLACYSACMSDAAQAARESARMAYLWAELYTDAPAPDAVTDSLLDWLLDHLADHPNVP